MQRSFKEDKPTLYIVSTPIGNLKDMTYRAVEILNTVELILCEDTRTSGVLLSHYNIKKPLLSYHEFNKEMMESVVLEKLNLKQNIALISDAGTPGINDPGYEMIVSAIQHDFHVVSIPGASAILAALVTSGLVIQPFTYLGFLPRKANEQKEYLKNYNHRSETLVIYESPLRVSKTLNTIYEVLGQRKIALCRELTKTFETIIRTTLEEAIQMDMNEKGEYVIIVEGFTDHEKPVLDVNQHYLSLIEAGYPSKDAMKIVAKAHQISKNEVYKRVKIFE